MTGLDYSAGRIPGATILAAGYDLVIRYVDDPAHGLGSKHVTRAEYADLIGAGVRVLLVFEVGVDDAMGGYQAGAANARRARTGADWIGYPADGVIFMACDRHITNTEIPAALAYLDGAASVLGPASVGCYGFFELIDAAATHQKAAVLWQCGVRPGPSDPVHLWQRNTGTTRVGGIECDLNDLLRPLPLFTGAVPAARPKEATRMRSLNLDNPGGRTPNRSGVLTIDAVGESIVMPVGARAWLQWAAAYPFAEHEVARVDWLVCNIAGSPGVPSRAIPYNQFDLPHRASGAMELPAGCTSIEVHVSGIPEGGSVGLHLDGIGHA